MASGTALTPRILPSDPSTATAEDQLDATGVDDVTPDRSPVVTGRAPIFDYTTMRFARGPASAPLMHTGLDALRGWIEKSLMTERDSCPVHPPGFGVQGRTEMLGQPIGELDAILIEERISAALTQHPRITAVVDLTLTPGEDGESVDLEMLIVTDVGDQLPIDVPLGVGRA